jgi:hypothetical protein
MDVSSIVKSTQEQAVASWIDHLNQLRVDELMANLTKQDVNLANALNVLGEFKLDTGNLINSNRGGEKGLHGFIAERAQVSIENARKLVEGLKAEDVLVDDNGPVDLLKNGIPIQQKFVQANISLNAIKEHFEKYPDFIKNGGKYQIPKDFYAALQKYAAMPAEQGNKLAGAEHRLYVAVQKFQKESGIDLKDIEPAVVGYGDVQKGKIDETIDREKGNIEDTDKKQREKFHEESKPTLQEGLKAALISSAFESVMSFYLRVAKKLKSGKKLNEFTEQDWKDVGIGAAKGAGKGAIRGVSVYTLTNFTATPAAVASALVTASFGVTAQALLLREGRISPEEFIENSEVVCLDVAVSAIASVMGQALIPIPVLGAVIGNAVGMFMYGIAKNNLSKQEQALILGFNENIQRLNEQLEAHYKALIKLLEQEFAKFKSVAELAFDLNVNIAFAGSVTLAQYVGCPEDKILKDKAAVDAFFLERRAK